MENYIAWLLVIMGVVVVSYIIAFFGHSDGQRFKKHTQIYANTDPHNTQFSGFELNPKVSLLQQCEGKKPNGVRCKRMIKERKYCKNHQFSGAMFL